MGLGRHLKKAIILTSIFAAAVLSQEWSGYALFDTDNGNNSLCDIDPTCRKLTEGEIKLAQKTFGSEVNYSNIKIFNRPYFYLVGNDGSNHAPNGNIYITDKYSRSEDYSKTPHLQRMFIHEMAHIWQFQNKFDPRFKALRDFKIVNNKPSYDANYHYKLDTNMHFDDYKMEQQAEIIADYFLKQKKIEELINKKNSQNSNLTHSFLEQSLSYQCRSIKEYENLLKGHLPVKNNCHDKTKAPNIS